MSFYIICIIEVNKIVGINSIVLQISYIYVQSVSTTFCLLLFPSISFYNWYQSQSIIMNSTQLSCLYLIDQGMNDETFEQIEGAKTASEACSILSTNYKGDDKI